jgi:pimeloyl-ACP methyl ester carboxylesterase
VSRIPLILVPGLLCDDALWAPQSEWLSDIADISIGETQIDDSFSAMAARILKAAPPYFALGGLSMGGYVCMEIMRQAPERIERLALLDTSGRADTADQTKRRKILIELATIGKFKGVTPRLLPLLIHKDRQTDENLTRTVIDMARRVGQAVFLRQQTAVMNRPDRRAEMAMYDLPTIVVCGRQDALTPIDLHEEMARLIPYARLCLIEECGHLSTLEQSHTVTALMRDWLLRD